ncbi:MAG: hypothetical protein BWK79_07615 [Beggiatoa sp. IS2]|nr:MAG: hypothetical protein BWK79_07615 [Beggiatoa sp. IS2]
MEDHYATPELTQRLNLICHLVQNSEQLVLVLAENGYGKTALLRQLQKMVKQQHEHWRIYLPASSPALSPDSLMATLLTTLNTRHEGKTAQALEETLRNQVAAARYNGQLPVLLIDDAHMLPLATLKLIVELAMQGEVLTRLRVVLFCEPQITSILVTPEFKIVHNTLIHTLDIPPFNSSQLSDYIQFRLKNTEYHFERLFTHQEIKRIYTLSEGVPGRVNVLAQQVLLKQGELSLRTSFTGRSPHSKLIWSTFVLLILVTVALIVRWNYPELFKEPTVPAVTEELSPAESPAVVQPHEITKQPIATTTDNNTITLPNHSLPTTAPTEQPVVKNNSENQSVVEKNSPTPTENKSANNDFNPATLMGRADIKDAVWLRNQNSRAYTIQVLGAHNPLTLKEFLSQYSLNEIAIFKTLYREQEWYVLVQGIYPDRATALSALEKLPEALRQNTQPWVRSLTSVQAYIDEVEP